ncbi:MAG: hypothetical protein JSS82_17265 [Bacteroidetes bacterium]|nr:hypothetical protein [Bacteroidota bacterium]
MLVTEYSDMGGNHSKDTAYNSHYVITLTDSNTMVIRWGNSNTVDTIFRQQNPVDSSKRADMSFIGWNSKLFSPLVYNVYYYNQQDSMYMNIFTTWSNSHTNYDFYGKK